MKKIFLFAFAVSCFVYSYSQNFSQGSKMVGGSIGLDFKTLKQDVPGAGTQTDGSLTNISFNPTGGYFIIDGVAAGAGLSFVSTTFKPDGTTGKVVLSQVSFSPFGRYYHTSGVFGHLGFDLGSAKDEDSIGGNTNKDKYSVFGIRFGAGYAIFLNDNVAVEPTLMYESTSMKDKATDVKDINNGLVIRIGFNIFL